MENNVNMQKVGKPLLYGVADLAIVLYKPG